MNAPGMRDVLAAARTAPDRPPTVYVTKAQVPAGEFFIVSFKVDGFEWSAHVRGLELEAAQHSALFMARAIYLSRGGQVLPREERPITLPEARCL